VNGPRSRILSKSRKPETFFQAFAIHPKSVGLSAAMCGAARGEHIARMEAKANVWERTGAETLKGLRDARSAAQPLGRIQLSRSRSILWGAGGLEE
jgi:hypothetical protein